MKRKDKSLCIARNCKRKWTNYFMCTPHYLRALDNFEKESRKSKLVAK